MKKEEKKEEKNEEPTDSTTEESVVDETTEDSQLNPNHRTVAISSLITGYVLAAGFAVLLLTGSDSEEIVSDSSNI